MRVLVTGATGFLGRHISAGLASAGHQVSGASRRNGFDYRMLTSPEVWLPRLLGIDAVVNCVGVISESRAGSFELLHHRSPVALFHACLQSGIRRVVQISSLGADGSATTRYHLSKRAADDSLRQLPLHGTIIRPSLVYGKGGRSMQFFERLAALPVIPLPDAGRQLLQPVHVGDLVQAVVHCLVDEKAHVTVDAVGAKPISLRDWTRLIRRQAGRGDGLIVSVPGWLAMATARLCQPVGSLITPDNLRMLHQGSIADPGSMLRLLGRMPMDIETGWRLR